MQDDPNGPGPLFFFGMHVFLSVVLAGVVSALNRLIFPEDYFLYTFLGFSLLLSGIMPSAVFKKISTDSAKKIANNLGMIAVVFGAVLLARANPSPITMLDTFFVLVFVAYGFFENKKRLHASLEQ